MSYQETKNNLAAFLLRLRLFEAESHTILGTVEDSKSRVVSLNSTFRRLAQLSLFQDDLFRQALRCVENELYRAGHVMAWAAFMDFLDEKMASDGFIKLRAARPNWSFGSIEDLREERGEYARIEAAKAIGLCSKTEMKAFHGLLNKRNESAHPSNYYPDLNETLGYISELINRIAALGPRTL